MNAKSLPKDLLEQAEFLTTKEPKRPKQATLRRAVSTAYYALFHLICAESVELLAPNVEPTVRHRMQRWFNHGSMKETCGRFLVTPLPPPLGELLGASASADLQRVAKSFINLQHARHLADYDMAWTVTRSQAQAYVQQSQDAREAWLRIHKSAEANVFVLSLLHWKQWQDSR